MENRTTKTRRARQRKARARKVLLTISLLLVVVAASVGGTLAWLTATTAPVTNTFTYGDINIELTETTGKNYKIIPGVNIAKDPKVTVKARSEACYLFVEVKEEGTFVANKVTYSIAEGWTALTGVADVYYREVSAVTEDKPYYVLAGNEQFPNGVITVSDTLTKEDIKDAVAPTLTFTAYAVQKDGIKDAATAWGKVTTTNP